MKEEFITFEQAVALYNLDFDWDCWMAYFDRPWNHKHRCVHCTIADRERRTYDGTDVYPAPTQALAQKWLREVKNWHIIIEPYNYHGIKTTGYLYRLYNPIRGFENHNQRIGFVSYESALSAGIDASLELIKAK